MNIAFYQLLSVLLTGTTVWFLQAWLHASKEAERLRADAQVQNLEEAVRALSEGLETLASEVEHLGHHRTAPLSPGITSSVTPSLPAAPTPH